MPAPGAPGGPSTLQLLLTGLPRRLESLRGLLAPALRTLLGARALAASPLRCALPCPVRSQSRSRSYLHRSLRQGWAAAPRHRRRRQPTAAGAQKRSNAARSHGVAVSAQGASVRHLPGRPAVRGGRGRAGRAGQLCTQASRGRQEGHPRPDCNGGLLPCYRLSAVCSYHARPTCTLSCGAPRLDCKGPMLPCNQLSAVSSHHARPACTLSCGCLTPCPCCCPMLPCCPTAAGSVTLALLSGRRSKTRALSASSALGNCGASDCRRRVRWWGWMPLASCRGRMWTAQPWRSATRFGRLVWEGVQGQAHWLAGWLLRGGLRLCEQLECWLLPQPSN